MADWKKSLPAPDFAVNWWIMLHKLTEMLLVAFGEQTMLAMQVFYRFPEFRSGRRCFMLQMSINEKSIKCGLSRLTFPQKQQNHSPWSYLHVGNFSWVSSEHFKKLNIHHIVPKFAHHLLSEKQKYHISTSHDFQRGAWTRPWIPIEHTNIRDELWVCMCDPQTRHH
jgi:hypothetical protein